MAFFKIKTKEDPKKKAMPVLEKQGSSGDFSQGMPPTSSPAFPGTLPGSSGALQPQLTQTPQAPQSQSISLFSDASKKKEALPDPRIAQLIAELNNESRRLRTLEERYILLRRKTQLTEQNMLSHYKKASGDTKSAASKIQELKNELREIKEKLGLIEKEVSQCAKKSELGIISKYVSYWNPAEFVTREEAARLIDKKLGQNNENR